MVEKQHYFVNEFQRIFLRCQLKIYEYVYVCIFSILATGALLNLYFRIFLPYFRTLVIHTKMITKLIECWEKVVKNNNFYSFLNCAKIETIQVPSHDNVLQSLLDNYSRRVFLEKEKFYRPLPFHFITTRRNFLAFLKMRLREMLFLQPFEMAIG